MSQLNQLPEAPAGVRYALTVPQSVLFADISLRGSRTHVMGSVFGGDFTFDYIAIDDGAMSWNYYGDAAFAKAFLVTSDPAIAARRFIAGMETTARAVERVSWLVASPATRRNGGPADVLADLNGYWDSYERHMTSLFTFWNVEELLSEALIAKLRACGHQADIQDGLQRFLQPSETNFFALERRRLAQLAARFGADDSCDALEAALEQHVEDFGFLLSPFNLGARPSLASLVGRVDELRVSGDSSEPPLDEPRDLLRDLPEEARELGLLLQELTFWKTERLDVMALTDARVRALYDAAATLLSIGTDDLFAMTRDELTKSLAAGTPFVDAGLRAARQNGFCMLLRDDEIEFFKPSRSSAPSASSDSTDIDPVGRIVGTSASGGSVSGRVRLIESLDDIADLQPGEILVTAMTRPEMGVALDRAAAFVTDEGGRMCHAAIISREMRKPCVIATGNATQILRTGMSVTVSGDEGIVTVNDDVSGR
jgi:phosphohistidine swiveling domain-containing protein